MRCPKLNKLFETVIFPFSRFHHIVIGVKSKFILGNQQSKKWVRPSEQGIPEISAPLSVCLWQRDPHLGLHHSKGVNQLKAPSSFLFFIFPHDMWQILWEKKKEMKFLLFTFQNANPLHRKSSAWKHALHIHCKFSAGALCFYRVIGTLIPTLGCHMQYMT
jgi:hypothetical protein